MPGQKPEYRFVTKAEGEKKWTEIGAAWKLAGGNFSVRLDPEGNGGEIRCLMVKANSPEAKKQAAPEQKPAP
jgi:hypothetical protein